MYINKSQQDYAEKRWINKKKSYAVRSVNETVMYLYIIDTPRRVNCEKGRGKKKIIAELSEYQWAGGGWKEWMEEEVNEVNSLRKSTHHESIDFDLRCARRFVGLRAEGLETGPQTARRLYAQLFPGRILSDFHLGDVLVARRRLPIRLLPVLEFRAQGFCAGRVLRLLQKLVLNLKYTFR